jgi:hypothetical protein
MLGDTDITLLPVPVLVTEIKPFEASVATADDAVSEENIGCAVNVETPVKVDVVFTTRVVSVKPVGRIILPVISPTKPLAEYTGPVK